MSRPKEFNPVPAVQMCLNNYAYRQFNPQHVVTAAQALLQTPSPMHHTLMHFNRTQRRLHQMWIKANALTP